MTGRLCSNSKVAGCLHQPRSKVILPDSIDPDPHGERILRIDDRLGQFQSTTAALERSRFRSGNDRDKVPGDFRTAIRRISASEDP